MWQSWWSRPTKPCTADMKKVVMCSNPYRDKNCRTLLAAQERLRAAGVESTLALPFDVDRSFELPRHIRFTDLEKAMHNAELLICFGGDGTILHAAKAATRAGIPILGVNIGTMGFIAELESEELSLLDRLARDEYTLDSRMMLDVKVLRDGQTVYHDLSLNDVVVTKGAVARVVRLSVYCDDVLALDYGGDGVIVATPTGSTAYSLSAGGPIVEPDADVMLINPICAHDIKTRCVVASGKRTIAITLNRAGRRNAFLSADGGKALRLNVGDVVQVTRAKEQTKLLRLKQRSFYDVIHTKFQNS